MQSYDQIKGFEYWSVEGWKGFIEEYIVPLHNSISKLLELRDFLYPMIGITLSEVERKRSDVLPFLLGGIKEDGEYKDNSLAKLVRFTLGVFINPRKWVTLEKEEGLKAFDYVSVQEVSTRFLEFLKKLNEISEKIIKLAMAESTEAQPSEVEGLVKKPEGILELLRSVYVKCLQVSANHNYYTFFAVSTKNLPYKHIISAYPRLQANFNLLKEFLGLEKIFEPKISEAKLREDYTVFGHSKDKLCYLLCGLNNEIWEAFSNEDVKRVLNFVSDSLRDLKREYAQKVQQKLEEIKWSAPTYINISHETNGKYHYTYVISGVLLVKEIHDWWSWKGGYQRLERECNISLPKLFDDISPALFLSSESIKLKLSDDRLEIMR